MLSVVESDTYTDNLEYPFTWSKGQKDGHRRIQASYWDHTARTV